MDKPILKPTLRGWVHQEAFFVSLGACLVMISLTKNRIAFFASLVYSAALLFQFGVSAIYHRPHWEPIPRARMKRLDHSAIFILIAGTFTPVCLLGLSKASGTHLLIVMWTVAFVGTLQSIFWVKAPKWLNGLLYIGAGWLIFPYASDLKQSLGQNGFLLILQGGIAYTIGALFYVFKKPNLRPGVFGYHELFHVMTVIGATLHFIAVFPLVVA